MSQPSRSAGSVPPLQGKQPLGSVRPMLGTVRKKLRKVSSVLRSEHPIKTLRATLNGPPPLVVPSLRHRVVKIDYYPSGETTRSIRAAYERVYGHDRKQHGVYAPRDWTRLSFALDQTIKGGSVLDVGPNRGQFPNMLAESKQFERVVAIDVKINPNFLPLHQGSIEYLAMSVADQRFADKSFDVVTCFEVLEHLEPDVLLAGIRELRRVCRRQLLVSVPYAEPLPLSRYHRRRFVDSDFTELFPNAKLTLLRSSRMQWMFLEESFDA